jgi:POT family proton-dependent oligopeptide transporter
VLFMAAALADGGFGFSRDQASAIVGIYGFSVYLASLPGGWVADRLLGLQRAIFVGACLITAGHLSIGLSGLAGAGGGKIPFFLGLVLIVLGTGLLKPNISAIVGDLYPEGGSRRDAGFSIFYMGINTGAFAGQLVTGALGEKVGWHWGFGAAGVGMLLGLVVFSLTARHRSRADAPSGRRSAVTPGTNREDRDVRGAGGRRGDLRHGRDGDHYHRCPGDWPPPGEHYARAGGALLPLRVRVWRREHG